MLSCALARVFVLFARLVIVVVREEVRVVPFES